MKRIKKIFENPAVKEGKRKLLASIAKKKERGVPLRQIYVEMNYEFDEMNTLLSLRGKPQIEADFYHYDMMDAIEKVA